MHELSIATSIINISEEEVQKAGATRVLEINLEIGELAGVVIEAMEFAMDVAVRGTVLEYAKVNIITIPGRARCDDCSEEFNVHDMFTPCPECKSFKNNIVSGKELKIESLNVE
jgi:hydrogenase nickel incorporation protein HypA/HybF